MHRTAAAGSRYPSFRLAVAVTVFLAAGSVAGCATTPPSSPAALASVSATPGSNDVSIHNFAFAPGSITVRAGATVTWTNADPQPTRHTASADGGVFSTGPLAPGQSGAFTFSTPGRYAYHCAIHTYMTGVIVVVP
jgi:plastocyanin